MHAEHVGYPTFNLEAAKLLPAAYARSIHVGDTSYKG